MEAVRAERDVGQLFPQFPRKVKTGNNDILSLAFRKLRLPKGHATASDGEYGVGFRREKIMNKLRLLGLAMLVIAWASQARAQFAHTEHKQIVDGGGPSGLRASEPLLVRATNLGNWMVPEGYMWLFE